MTKQWSFTDIEFSVMWERIAHRERIPRPLTYLARTSSAEEYARATYLTWERLREELDPVMWDVIAVLARSEIRFRSRAWCDADPADPKLWIRARAGRTGMHGYVVVQTPGETREHSGGYTVIDCGARGIAEVLVGMLPQVQAGSQSDIPIQLEPVREANNGMDSMSMVSVFDSEDTSTVSRADQFWAQQATRTGLIIIEQGISKFGPQGRQQELMIWRDLPDDGRYVIAHPAANPVAVGMDARRMTATLDATIDKIVDRVETHWEMVP
ncbi:ESX secretion-associated protein EspG [Nocardia sp. NPDC058705]|uniref:ESX secretion-associated protein EspG n=1 Tax=Nocardia sp. NPDC058705 TaxID=3346609 RepID=UPI0036792B8E